MKCSTQSVRGKKAQNIVTLMIPPAGGPTNDQVKGRWRMTGRRFWVWSDVKVVKFDHRIPQTRERIAAVEAKLAEQESKE